MLTLAYCSGCNAALQPPQGADSFRCPFCLDVTRIVSSPPLGVGFSSPSAAAPPYPYPYPPPEYRIIRPAPAGRKKAVICGIWYANSTARKLPGCVRDAKYMQYVLITKFHFPADHILMLTEEETDPNRIPTNQNMRMAMRWLVSGCQPGDSLVFHFSGHGVQRRDWDGDEIDGLDEALCPLDFESQGMILDDEINDTLVRPLPHGVKLHTIIDACHSGTALDLPYLCRMNRSGHCNWEDHRPPSGKWKGSSGGEVISFSGCADNQKAFDTAVVSPVSSGHMTRFLIEAIESGHSDTYGSILNYIRSSIQSIGGHGALQFPSTVVDEMRQQEPQLTSSHVFDVHTKPFSL